METRLSFVMFLLIVAANSGDCLKCYMCEPDEAGETCDKNFGKLEACDVETFKRWLNTKSISTSTDLAKVFDQNPKCTKISMISPTESAYLRTCMPNSQYICQAMREAFRRDPDVANIKIKCDFCNTDSCNGSSILSVTNILVTVVAATLIKMTF